MQVQINAPEIAPSDYSETAERTVREALRNYEDRLTRVEVHLRDLNGHKGGVDKRCVVEVRPRGLDPVAAECESEKVHDALRGALEKMGNLLSHRFGKLGG